MKVKRNAPKSMQKVDCEAVKSGVYLHAHCIDCVVDGIEAPYVKAVLAFIGDWNICFRSHWISLGLVVCHDVPGRLLWAVAGEIKGEVRKWMVKSK